MQKPIEQDTPVNADSAASGSPYDVALLFAVMFLVGIGLVMVYSASSALALKKFGTDYYFIKKQVLFSVAGFMILLACRHIPYPMYRLLTYPMLLVAIIALLAVELTGFGLSAGGAARWLRLGSFTFQPSEFVRLALVVFLAYSLSRKTDAIREFSIGFVPHVLVLSLLSVPILLQPDFGSVVILAVITWVMMFVAGVRIKYLLVSVACLIPVGYACAIHAPYRLRRLMSFIDPWKYSTDEGYQIVHSLMAFGSGGVWGKGIGNGYQKLFYLPEPHTDFIFSVIGEEVGLLGICIIMALYLLIIFKGISIARNARDLFGSFMAIGLTTAIGLQVCVNMGVALGLLPTKGLTLPFLSYGGTSLLMNMASVGILMNIGAAKAR
ncbi:MAG: putative lipid II flippase FtsW [Desulfobacterales bacterium]|nr:putative lipid II flippase FtsW [Desulfobacterales bacterium]MDD4071311.1 putative lipid II flippase FtsW [Desulfobacterales bacterium]MDD4393005.1 putative lipid II flippase FtsW [Desulfobacterales bacterium]